MTRYETKPERVTDGRQDDAVNDRIRALGAQIKAHQDLAAALKREVVALRRQAGIDSNPQSR